MLLPLRAIYRVLFFLILISLPAMAQNNFKIDGRVIDFDTRQPLKNISIVRVFRIL